MAAVHKVHAQRQDPVWLQGRAGALDCVQAESLLQSRPRELQRDISAEEAALATLTAQAEQTASRLAHCQVPGPLAPQMPALGCVPSCCARRAWSRPSRSRSLDCRTPSGRPRRSCRPCARPLSGSPADCSQTGPGTMPCLACSPSCPRVRPAARRAHSARQPTRRQPLGRRCRSGQFLSDPSCPRRP